MYVVVYKLSITSPYALIESTTLTYTSADVAVSLCTFNTSVSCITNLAPPVTSSTELAGGILKSFAMYLSVDPVTETHTSIAIAAAVVLRNLVPYFFSYNAIAIATAKPLLATFDKLLLYSIISVPSEYTSFIDLSLPAKVVPVPDAVLN
jgi:hypothetical protein